MNFATPVDPETINKTIAALTANGIQAELAPDKDSAVKRVFNLIPPGSEVMTMSSVTLDSLGISHTINEAGQFNSIKNQLKQLDRVTDSLKMQKLGAAPEYSVGSVHAVTHTGQVLIASNTGSQLPAYVYGSAHVIWVVGTQKIVPDLDAGIKRIYDYILPLESARLNKLYNTDRGSFVSKLLIINREIIPGRIHLIFVPEILGF